MRNLILPSSFCLGTFFTSFYDDHGLKCVVHNLNSFADSVVGNWIGLWILDLMDIHV